MTSEEYWRMYDAVQGDLDITISSVNTYLTIRRFASNDKKALKILNRQEEFWRITSYAYIGPTKHSTIFVRHLGGHV